MAEVRAMTAADVDQAQEVSHRALHGDAAADDATRRRGRSRIRHLLEHDPRGAWVLAEGPEVRGLALASSRGGYWYLSLLAVAAAARSAGWGRALLAASMTTFTGSGGLCASDDPAALRSYRLAGFDLAPCYEARGPLDRSLLPAGTGVRGGDLGADREWVEAIALARRGAAHGPDLDWAVGVGCHLLVHPGGGYALASPAGPVQLAASTEPVATALLWAALAEASEQQVRVSWLDQDQQWALDVALAARLPVGPRGSRCQRGPVRPKPPYLPSGGLG